MNHTPGPWHILDGRIVGEQFLSIFTLHEDFPIITRIENKVSGKPIGEDDVANANLIASAPELLEIVFELLKHRTKDKDGNYVCWVGESLLMKAEEAFCKAIGEPIDYGPVVPFEDL